MGTPFKPIAARIKSLVVLIAAFWTTQAGAVTALR